MQRNFSLILANTSRSIHYFEEIKKKKLFIDTVIIYSKSKKNTLLNKVKKYNFKKKIFFFNSQNLETKKIIKLVLSIKSKYIIFSGYNAEIIKNPKILKKNLLHCHPGLLPNYRGSTVIYYSLLSENKTYSTIFRMTKKIDKGAILYTRKNEYPKNLYDIEKNYDHIVRSKSLAEFLCNTKKLKIFNPKNKKIDMYYIAHPVIRDIVVNTKRYLKNNT